MSLKNKMPLFIGGATILGVILYSIKKASAKNKTLDYARMMDFVEYYPLIRTGFGISEQSQEEFLAVVFPFYNTPLKGKTVSVDYNGDTLKYQSASGSVYNKPFTTKLVDDTFKEVQRKTNSKHFSEKEIKVMAALLEAERGSFENKGLGSLSDIRESGAIVWALLNRMALDPSYSIEELIYDPPSGNAWKAWNVGLKDRIKGKQPSRSAFDMVVLVLSGIVPNEIGDRTNLLHIYTQLNLGRDIPNWALPKDHPDAYTLNMTPPIMVNDGVFSTGRPA
jgi:hypothetical protein